MLIYVTDPEHYKEKIKDNYEKLEKSIPEINKLFNTDVFDTLLTDLEDYDKNVKKNYNEFISTNEIWNKLKNI